MHKSRSALFTTLICLAPLACDDGGGGDADTGADDVGTTGDTGEGEDTDTGGEGMSDPDSDGDGLTDSQEAELGTDPNAKDTDADNYWDSWEVTEGTDPLDPESRIYTGYWPYNPDKDALVQGTWAQANTTVGSPFARQTYLDQHGDEVDIYDFANFTNNESGEPSFIIVDMSAQWCGPCHNMAEWISGVDNSDTLPYQQVYPSLRDKVHSLRVWWITIIVEDANGGPPTVGDTSSWAQAHQDAYIPVLADETQQIRDTYNAGQYPFVFLVDPAMALYFWEVPQQGGTPQPALWAVQQYL